MGGQKYRVGLIGSSSTTVMRKVVSLNDHVCHEFGRVNVMNYRTE